MDNTLPVWQKPLLSLTETEWESLCDQCGLCCVEKLDDDDFIYYTRVACDLLDTETGRCSDYCHRHSTIPDCIQLTRENIYTINWLPPTCAYVLRASDEPLPEWHPLLNPNGRAHPDFPGKIFEKVVFLKAKDLQPDEDFSDYLLSFDDEEDRNDD